MADSRINLLSSASSTASDDFFVVDGNTNGTRKLNAFSPTIGGNLAVTGTLTANGLLTAAATTSLDGLPTAAIFGATKRIAIGYNTSGDYGFIASADSGTTWKELHLNPVGGIVKVPNTSASTTTSTGALVVGNGTSGGLGVGGSVVLGANLVSTASDGKFQITGTGNTTGNKEIGLQRSDAADSFVIGLTGSAYAGALTGLGNNEAFIYNSSASAFRIFLGTAATNRFDFTNSQFKINAATASTTTSTGALVVGGGVGVGGAINAGGDIATASTMRSIGFHVPGNGAGRPANTDSYLASTATTQIPLYVSGYTGGGQSADILRVSLNSTSDWFSVKGNGQVSCFATTASTSTSSGALVVSGGVGVAGAMNVGGSMKLNYFSTAGDPTALGVVQLYATTNTTSGAGGIEWKADAGGNGYGYRTLTVFDGVSAYDLYTQVRTNSASWTNSLILKSNGNVTFAGTLTVNGGTASVASANGTTSSMIRSTVGGTATTGNGIFSSYLSSLIEWQFGGVSSDSSFRISSNGLGTADQFKISSSGNVSIPSTQASTTTSSGALVVSGGVGVAGALYAANLGGTSTNNNAASGCIGEYTSATTAYASKVSLTSNTAANIVSISLTAGDWDVQFNPVFTQDTPLTTSGLLAGVSSSSATLPSGAAERAHSPSGPNGNSDISIAPPVTRISLASTTTIYGVATGIFSAGTMSAYGFIRARRVR